MRSARRAAGLLVALVCARTSFAQAAPQPALDPQATAAQAPVAGPPEAPPVPQAAERDGDPVRSADEQRYQPRYHDHAEVAAWIARWSALRSPKLVAEPLALPATREQRSVPAFQWGPAGSRPLAERPTIFLIGGLDGVSLAGGEGVLAVCDALLFGDPPLEREVTFVVIPWAAPDALARTLAGTASDGRDGTPVDDDGDLELDEDGPDDLDGDKLVLDMLIEDPAGPWTFAADPRFLAPARAGDARRFRFSREGRDDDQDGSFNEDARGGIELDLDFGCALPRRGAPGAPLPFDQPLTRALAELVLSRATACVLLFQGNHGQLAHPRFNAGTSAAGSSPDGQLLASLTQAFAHATGRAQEAPLTLEAAHGAPRDGAALEWMHAVGGALAFELAVWGPAVEQPREARGVGLADARFESEGVPARDALSAPQPAPVDRAWAHWLDNTRGGIGFTDWHPVDLGGNRSGLIGGWQPFSRLNPPPESLPSALAGLERFVARIATALPELELRFAAVERDGEVCTIRARLENRAGLPAGLATSGRFTRAGGVRAGERGATVELLLPAGARMLAGESRVHLAEPLAAGGASRELCWIVLAPPGCVLAVRAEAPWCAPILREVKP